MGVIIKDNEKVHYKYLFEYFCHFLNLIDIASNSNPPSIDTTHLQNLKIPLPPLDIQEKIVQELEVREQESQKLKMENENLKDRIREIISKVESGKWKMEKIENILEKINGNNIKIQQNEILENGRYPVVTQENGELIAGYTNVDKPITDLPLVVFGDHSCTFKYIDFPFVRGADGTQLLKPNRDLNIKYFYYILKELKIPEQDKYTRHMKYLKSLKIPLPPLDIQQEIVKKIESIEKKIEANNQNIERLNIEKEEILKSKIF